MSLFHSIFPTYWDYKIPIWSTGEFTKDGYKIQIVVPGYEKADFSLYVEDKSLFLNIYRGGDDKEDLLYSILGGYGKGYDIEKATAEYKSGILTISVPKIEIKKEERKAIGIS